MLQVENVGTTRSTSVAAKLVRVVGDVDFASAQTFRNGLERALCAGADTLIVSFEECQYIDSTALGVLIEMDAAIGARLKLVVNEDTCVRRILSITGLDRTLNIFSSVSKALETTVGRPRTSPGSGFIERDAPRLRG